jgi:hypothetical protein
VYAGEDAAQQTLPSLTAGTAPRIFPTDTTPLLADTPEKLRISLGEAFDEPITATVAGQLASLFIY